jgi:NCS1 nucleoside transporter family
VDETNKGTKPLVERYGLEAIPKHAQDTSAIEYTFIQMAISVNAGNVLVPALAVLEGGLTFLQAVLSTVIGAAFAFICVSFLALPGAKYGIPAQYSIRAILGVGGTRYLASPIRTVTSMYWFAVQTIGGTYLIKELIERTLHIQIPFLGIALVMATLMAVLALIGFEAVKKATKYFLPILFVGGLVMLFILLTSEVEGRTFQTVINSASSAPLGTMLFFASLAFVQYVSGVSSASDMARYAKSEKHAFYGLFLGNLSGFFLTAILGAYTAALAGSVNPYVISSQLTNSTLALTIILVAAMSSMVMINISNAYTGGYSLLNSLPSLGRVKSAVLFGCCAIFLSSFPILAEQAQTYISYLGALIIPISAVIVFDFLLLKKRKFTEGDFLGLARGDYQYNFKGLSASIVGMALYLLLPSGWSPGFIAFIGTGVIYIIFSLKSKSTNESNQVENVG